ncbi:MAG: signal peptidase I [Candidatus Nanopelagicales bacterium]|nr:signal peptidase I [Candidatus Nanopelagicales bacterium]MCF8551155.1 signal peptidase I [Candidatus Nanopelagicales bacterium]
MKFLLWLGGGIAALWLVTTFVVQQYSIPSNSMEPTLVVNDRVVVNHTAYLRSPVRRGDVIVFNGQDSLSADETDFVKRVVGVGGDRVACCDAQGRVTVNGEPVDEQSYIFPGDSASEIAFDVEVPDDKLWVMGDHRSESADSRSQMGMPGGGFVSINNVRGQVIAVMWPPSRIGLLRQQ